MIKKITHSRKPEKKILLEEEIDEVAPHDLPNLLPFIIFHNFHWRIISYEVVVFNDNFILKIYIFLISSFNF